MHPRSWFPLSLVMIGCPWGCSTVRRCSMRHWALTRMILQITGAAFVIVFIERYMR